VRVWGIDFTLTLDHYLRVDPGLAQLHGLPTVWTSVKIAGFAAPFGGLLSLVIAYLVERVRPPGGNAIGFVALLPAVLPGVILGIGYLIFRSTFLPRILGVLMAIAGSSYLTNSFAGFLAPELRAHLLPYILVPCGVAELSLTLWLLVMGVNVQRWKEQAKAGFLTS